MEHPSPVTCVTTCVTKMLLTSDLFSKITEGSPFASITLMSCLLIDIRVYARDIGIDPDNEPELLCLAKEAIFAHLPPGWTESYDESGKPIFHNHYLQTTTNEHPCKVQYRKMVAQERERIQRAGAIQLDRKETEETNNTHAVSGLKINTRPSPPTRARFFSGFLSLISCKCDETTSLTLISFDDDVTFSEKEYSGGTVSGGLGEKLEILLDKAHSWDQSSGSPLQQLSSGFPISDNSIYCDSQLETDEKDEETDTDKSPDESGNDSSAKEDQEKDILNKPGRSFYRGFLSVLGFGKGECFFHAPSSSDHKDNGISAKEGFFRSGFLSIMHTREDDQVDIGLMAEKENPLCFDYLLEMDVKERADQVTEAPKSQAESRNESSSKYVWSKPKDGHNTGTFDIEGSEDEEEDSPITDSEVAIRVVDPAEEITELEVQSDDQSPESPEQEVLFLLCFQVSERVLDSSDSVFETETSSKSQDESGNDSSVEDEDIQCGVTCGRSLAKHKEDFPKTNDVPTKELLRKTEEEKEEEMELFEREMEKKIQLRKEIFLDVEQSKWQKELSTLFCQEELMRDDGPAEQSKREKEMMLSHQLDQLRKEEEEEMEKLRIEKDKQIWQQNEAIRREDKLMRDKETSVRLHQEASRMKEEEMDQFETEMKTTHLHKEKLLTDCQEKLLRNKEEEAEQFKWKLEMQMHLCQKEEEIEQLRHIQEVRISRQKEELISEEEEEIARLMTEKETRVCRQKVELRKEEEEEVERLKHAKEMRLRHRREELRKGEEEEEEWLKKEIDMRKCFFEEEINRAQREAEQLMMQKQMKRQFCLEVLRKEEVEQAEQLKREKEIRMFQQKEELMEEEMEEVALLKKEVDERIRRYLEELRCEEEEEAQQLKREKEMRMQHHLEGLQREEEEQADVLKKEKNVRFNLSQEQQLREKQAEEERLKNDIERSKRLHEEELRREEDEAQQRKRERATRTHLRQQEELKRHEEEQTARDKMMRLHQEEMRREEEENEQLMREKDLRNSLLTDQHSREDEEEEVAWLRRGKEMRIRLYQERLRREEEDEVESFKRKQMTRMCLHQEMLKREEEKEVEQLQRERQTRMSVFQEELRRQEVNELEKLWREMTERSHHLLEGLQEEEKPLIDENAGRKNIQSSSEGKKAKRLKGQKKERRLEKAKSWPRRKEHSTKKEAKGLFMREMERPKKDHGEELQSDNEADKSKRAMTQSWISLELSTEGEVEGQFAKKIDSRTMCHGEEKERTQSWLTQESSTEEEVAWKFPRKMESRTMLHGDETAVTQSWPSQESTTEEEVEVHYVRHIGAKTRLRGGRLRSQDEEVGFWERESRVPLRHEMKEDEFERFRREKTRSWPCRKAHGTREGVKGLFIGGTETQTSLHKEGSRSEDDEGELFNKEKILSLVRQVELRKEEDEAQQLEREKTKTWPRMKERSTKKEAKELFRREIERKRMLREDESRSEDEQEKGQMQLHLKKVMRKEDKEQQFEKEKAKSWPRRKETFKGELSKDELRNEDEKEGSLGMALRMSLSEAELKEIEDEAERPEKEKTKSGICTEEDIKFRLIKKIETQTSFHEDDVGDEEDEIWCSSGDEEKEGPVGSQKQVERSRQENETHVQQEVRKDDAEEEDFLKRQKQRRIFLITEKLKQEEKEEVEALQREKDTRMRQYKEKLRRDEEVEADNLKRAKEQRICLLLEKLKQEEEEEAERLKRDKEMRMSLLHEKMQSEVEDGQSKWGNEGRTCLHQEEQNKHGEKEKRTREDLRKEDKEAAEETAQVGQSRNEKEKPSHLQEEVQVQVQRTRHSQETSRNTEDNEVEQFKMEEKRTHYSQDNLKTEEDNDAEQLKVESENRMDRLQDELKRETEELINKLKAEKQKRTRLRQINQWGEIEERKLKTEYKERLKALRQYLLAKRRDEETLLDKMFEEKEKLTESAWMDRDEDQLQFRQDRKAAIRALCLAIEDERETENDNMKAERRQFFERIKAEPEEDLHELRTRFQEDRTENLKCLNPEIVSQHEQEKSFNPGFRSTFSPTNRPAPESQHEIFSAFRSTSQRIKTAHPSPFRPTLAAPHPRNTTPTYSTTHPSSLLSHAKATLPANPFITTSLKETYMMNPSVGYCNQLGLNRFNEITVYRFQRQNSQWTASPL
ncbi:trichohyalin-like isoform X2 [Syngnathus scovelli]|uniref:trichohyalin-like isoform X2 n=1 Tax=Syngnathus scovelli TaxID=161590 RepID=UPI0035CC65FD